jgi:hypothetical protein
LSIQAARAGLDIVADHRERSAGAMFQLAAMLRVGPMGWDREDQLDLAEIGGETGTATHGASTASPGRKPKRLVSVNSPRNALSTSFANRSHRAVTSSRYCFSLYTKGSQPQWIRRKPAISRRNSSA